MRRPKHFWAPILITASLTVGACDVVQFPGSGPRDDAADRSKPPPPPTTEVNPIPISEDVLDNASFEGDEALDTPADAADETTTPVDAEAPVIADLLTVNAQRCAPSTAETLTLAEAANAQPASSVFTPQTINGTEVTASDFPGIVKMEPRRQIAQGISSGHCGATRIAKNWFVTAAHCLDNIYDEIRLIATPSSLRNPTAVQVEATASICHAAYGGASGNYANDIALVAISDADADGLMDVPLARFGETTSPLTQTAYPLARMAGWGLTSFGGNLSDTLLSAELNVVATGPAAITVASRDGAGPCIGDSGGPLMIDEADGAPTVVGVLSVVEQNRESGEFCTGDYRARYTNVQGYIDWIGDVIAACDGNVEICARDVTTPR
ncbi:MAG: trypsin-like serine protease [Pseudomonadota bacterium]